MEITYDSVKDSTNIAKHGLSLATASDLDWDTALIWRDSRKEYGEIRLSATVLLGTRLHFVAFVDRGDERRIISLRKANAREVKLYVSNH